MMDSTAGGSKKQLFPGDGEMSIRHVQDVGRILLDVEKELQGLREKLSSHSGIGEGSLQVEAIIKKAENELRQKADLVLTSSMSANLQRLPLLKKEEKTSPKALMPTRHRPASSGTMPIRRVTHSASNKTHQLIEDNLQRMMANIESVVHRENKKDIKKPASRRRPRKPMRSTLSKRHQKYQEQRQQTTREEVDGMDFNRRHTSVLEMINKGLIPKEADMSAAIKPSMTHYGAPMYEWSAQFEQRQHQRISLLSDGQGLMSNIKFDLDETKSPSAESKHQDPVATSLTLYKPSVPQPSETNTPLVLMLEDSASPSKRKKEETLGETVERIRGYDELLDTYDLHMFIIRNGKSLTRSPEFVAFKQKYAHIWGSVSSIIESLEELMVRFTVPIAYVDGQRIVELAVDELTRVTDNVLLSCVRNSDQVVALVKFPGRQYVSGDKHARQRAATKIQSNFRRFAGKKHYHEKLHRDRSARLIQITFKVFRLKRALLARLRSKRENDEATWNRLQRSLAENWTTIKARNKVVVHIPALSYGEHLRVPISHFGVLQNLQMSRLCDIAEPNVEVIYISPFELPNDVLSYYEKLLTVGGCPSAGTRFKVIVPENAHRFPEHFSLSTALLYSPKALKKVKRMVESRSAYIVPGSMGEDDRLLSLALNLPVLGTRPDVVELYSSKSGAKRIFNQAGVSIPLGAHDIYEEHELFSTLAKLVAANLDHSQWILKIDDEFGGRGHCIVDVEKFRAVHELRVERAKQSSKFHKSYWARPDVQEQARRKLEKAFTSYLPSKAKVMCPQVYPNWRQYLRAFIRVGGIIEAMAESIVGNPAVNLLIEPDGTVGVVSTHEQLFSTKNRFQYVGCSFPQKVVPFQAMKGAAVAIGKTMFSNGITGYVGVDFVAYWDSANDALRLWAVDCNIRMTNAVASFKLFHFLMKGDTEEQTGTYKIKHRSSQKIDDLFESSQSENLVENVELQSRSFVAFDTLQNPNLSVMPYGSFFNVCRLHGVSFDLLEMKGLCFTLCDSLSGGVIGAMAIGQTPNESQLCMHRGLSFIHKHVGAYSTRKADLSITPMYDGTCSFSEAFTLVKTLIKR